MSGIKWCRPNTVPFPSIWRRFDGNKPVGTNNIVPKFRVQDVTEDLHKTLIEHMVTFFLRDEPLTSSCKLLEDEVSTNEMKELWREVLKHKVALVCLVDNWEELNDPNLPKIAGCNFTLINEKDTKDPELKGVIGNKILALVNSVSHQVDCFKHYGVNEYLYAFGLSVDPIFRGQGVGLEILKARFDIGRALGLKLTVTVFTAIASQKLAERAGFETMAELKYDDYKINGEIVFKNIATKSVKLMAARIE